MMKKITALLLVMLMVFAMAACGAAPAGPAQEPSAQPAADAPAAEAAEPTPASPIDTLTVGTTASIETAVFGEYNFDMLASGLWSTRIPRANTIRCWQPTARKTPPPGPTPFRTE